MEIKCWICKHSRQVWLLSSVVLKFFFLADIIMSFFKVNLEMNIQTKKFFPSWLLSDVRKPPISTVFRLIVHCLEISNVEYHYSLKYIYKYSTSTYILFPHFLCSNFFNSQTHCYYKSQWVHRWETKSGERVTFSLHCKLF